MRFDELTKSHDDSVRSYKDLKHVSGSFEVRWRMSSLAPVDDEEVFDKLEWLWPNVPDIHAPPRQHYALRCSLLVGEFPSAAPHSPEVYTNSLLSHVAVKAPSCMVLEAACFELVDTYKYSNAPNIADFMSLLDKHTELWDERIRIDNEIQSGRAMEYAKRRLAYEEAEERKRIEWTIARLEKLKSEEELKGIDPAEVRRIKALADLLIADLREDGIDALDEEKVNKLGREVWKLREEARIAERNRDPNWKAIQAFLKQFKLKEWHHDELAETVYKAAIKEAVSIASVLAEKRPIPPDTLGNINQALVGDRYLRARDFIKQATFKTLHLQQEKPKAAVYWDDDDDEQPRKGTRIVF